MLLGDMEIGPTARRVPFALSQSREKRMLGALSGRRSAGVSRGRAREFWCSVVSEPVMIRLKRPGGFGRVQGYFVQCNQTECQYVEENKPPCPLHAGLFADEIKAAEEARGARREEVEG
jgi:hypothetical protein